MLEHAPVHLVSASIPNIKAPFRPEYYLHKEVLLLRHPLLKQWQETTVQRAGKPGQHRIAFDLGEHVLKIGEHGDEAEFCRWFPGLTARVLWAGPVRVAFTGKPPPCGEETVLQGEIQEKVELAVPWLEMQGVNSSGAWQWLVYTLVALMWLEWHGVHLKDLGASNLSLTLGQTAHPYLKLCDAGSWYWGKKQSVLPGFWAVVSRFAPARAQWLHSTWKNNKNQKQVLVDLLLPECQNYHTHLLRHEIMSSSLKLQAQKG